MTASEKAPTGIGGWIVKNFGPIIEKAVKDGISEAAAGFKDELEGKVDGLKDDIEAKVEAKLNSLETSVLDQIKSAEQNVLGNFSGISGPLKGLIDQFNAFLQKVPHIPGLF